MKALINTKERQPDGSYENYQTLEVPCIETANLPRKGQTVCGYGGALPTHYMVKYLNRWHRVKVACFSNAGAAYIGKRFDPQLTVDFVR